MPENGFHTALAASALPTSASTTSAWLWTGAGVGSWRSGVDVGVLLAGSLSVSSVPTDCPRHVPEEGPCDAFVAAFFFGEPASNQHQRHMHILVQGKRYLPVFDLGLVALPDDFLTRQ